MPFKKYSPGGCRCCATFSMTIPKIGSASGPSASITTARTYNGQSGPSVSLISTTSSFLESNVLIVGLDYITNKWLVLNANTGSPTRGIWRCNYLLQKEDLLWDDTTDIFTLLDTIKGNSGLVTGVDTAGCLLYDSFKLIGWFEKRRYSVGGNGNIHKQEWEYVKVEADGSYTETSTNESFLENSTIYSGGWGSPSMDTSDETVYSSGTGLYQSGTGLRASPFVFNDSPKSIPANTGAEPNKGFNYAASAASYKNTNLNTYGGSVTGLHLSTVFPGSKVFVGGTSLESGPQGLIYYPCLYECTSSSTIEVVQTILYVESTQNLPFYGTGLYNTEYDFYSTGNFDFFNDDCSIYFKLLNNHTTYYYYSEVFACLSETSRNEIRNAFL